VGTGWLPRVPYFRKPHSLDLLLRVNAEESHHGISACNSLRGAKTHSAAWSVAGHPEPVYTFASLQRRQPGNIPATHLRPWSAQPESLAACLVAGPATSRSRRPQSRSCLVARSTRPHHQPSHRRGRSVPHPPLPLVFRGRPLSTGVVWITCGYNVLNQPMVDIQHGHRHSKFGGAVRSIPACSLLGSDSRRNTPLSPEGGGMRSYLYHNRWTESPSTIQSP